MNNKENKFQFEDLRVWQQAMDLSQMIYQLIKSFPKSEQYGLSDQLRRAVVSITLNIAEGKGRYSQKEFIQFLYLARGSLYETATCLKLAVNLNYVQSDQIKKILQQTHHLHAQLNNLIKSVKERANG